MNVTCPICQTFIEIDNESDIETEVCPNCRSALFNAIQGDQTTGFSGKLEFIGHFQLLEELGRGGNGIVWKAKDTRLDRVVAIKVPKQFDLDSREREMFLREARAAAQLQHPNIVGVFEIGTSNDGLFIVSDFVQGSNLREWLTGFQPDSRRIAELLSTVCSALHHAHEQGVIHRDLKPANIMMDLEDQPHIMDFGLAKRESGEATMTIDGQIMGTPMYMSPEQAKGKSKEVDRRADIYSLGVILFELLTGDKPFRGDPRVILTKIINHDPPKPGSLRTSVPKDLETVCLKCLEKEPAKRYSDANEVRLEFQRFLDGKPIVARPVSTASRAWRLMKRWPVVSALSASLLLATIIGGVGITSQWLRGNSEWTRAEQNAIRMQAEEVLKNRTLYVAHMNAIQLAWGRGMMRRVRGLLDRHIPDSEASAEDDLRTFEWYYYNKLCNNALSVPVIDFDEKISSMAIAPNDKFLALTGEGEKLEIWNLGSRENVQELSDKPSSTKRLEFSSDGSVLISIGNRWITVWKMNEATSRFDNIIQKQVSQPHLSRLSADGHFVVTVHENSIWCFDTLSSEIFEFQQPGHVFQICFFDPEKSVLISLAADPGKATLKRIELDDRKQTVVHSGKGADIRELLLSEDRTKLVTIDDIAANVYQIDKLGKISNPMRLKVFPLHGTDLVRLTENETFIAVNDYSFSSWRYDEPDQIARLSTDQSFTRQAEHGRNSRLGIRSQHLVASKTNPILASTGSHNVVHLWSNPEFESLGTLHGHANSIYGIGFRKSGELVTCSRDKTARIWSDLTTEKTDQYPCSAERLWSVAISPDNTKLASACEDARVVLWDLESGEKLGEFPGGSPGTNNYQSVQFVRFSPDGKKLVFGGYDHKLHVYDLQTMEESLELVGHTGTVNSFGFSADGKSLASGSNDSSVIIWDLSNGEIKKSIVVEPKQYIWAVAFSPLGNEVVFGGVDHAVHSWKFDSEESHRTLVALDENVTSLNYSNDGTKLSITTSDGIITLWDSHEKTTTRLLAHSSDAMFTAFSPDGKTLVSGGSEGALQFWNMVTQEPTILIQAHDQHIHAVSFSSDGSRVATASWDGTSKVFRSR